MTRPAAAAPVFVDSTGRRRRRLRRASYVFGGLCLAYAILVSVSLAGGPVSPGSVLPLRILADGDPPGAAVITTPGPLPQPSRSSAPLPKPVAAGPALPRHTVPAHRLERTSVATPPSVKRTPTPKPSKTPASPPPTSRPVESTSTSTSPPTPSTPVTAPAPKPPTGTA
jgi:hypothetical protein